MAVVLAIVMAIVMAVAAVLAAVVVVGKYKESAAVVVFVVGDVDVAVASLSHL